MVLVGALAARELVGGYQVGSAGRGPQPLSKVHPVSGHLG